MRSKNKSPRSARVTAIGLLGLVLAGLGAGILMASHESSSQIARLPTVDATPSHLEAEPTATKEPTARPQAKVTVTASPVSVMPATRVAAAAPKAPPVESKASAVELKVPAVESVSRTLAPEATPVTITGCLERDDATFRLKDTTGTDAPKSRNWKRGFLKKGMAPIEVVDAANRLNLSNHVGQRVSVTGLLVDREMTLRSLQRVAASCD